jgi:hypothetical protein
MELVKHKILHSSLMLFSSFEHSDIVSNLAAQRIQTCDSGEGCHSALHLHRPSYLVQ